MRTEIKGSKGLLKELDGFSGVGDDSWVCNDPKREGGDAEDRQGEESIGVSHGNFVVTCELIPWAGVSHGDGP